MRSVIQRYTNIVRKLFLICGLVLLVTLPFLRTSSSWEIFYPIVLILALTFFAGMTNPKQKHIIIGDIVVSVLGFAIFTYQAIMKFSGFFDLFFITNFSLAVLFLFAFYWSIKTIRSLGSARGLDVKIDDEEDAEDDDVEEKPTHGSAHGSKEIIINATENAPIPEVKPHKHIPTEEERRKLRFLREE